jgi:hypothetical protein
MPVIREVVGRPEGKVERKESPCVPRFPFADTPRSTLSYNWLPSLGLFAAQDQTGR